MRGKDLVAAVLTAFVGLSCGAGQAGDVLVTDFAEPHPWNPRPWACSGGVVSNGLWKADFTKRGCVDLLHSVDLPFVPTRFHLTVEAPAEAGGMTFTMILGQKDIWTSAFVGELRVAKPGERTIRQTLDVEADLSRGWHWEEHGVTLQPKWSRVKLPARLIGFWVHKNRARSDRFDLRLVSLTADPDPSTAAPVVLLTPIGGDSPPRTVQARLVNATTNGYAASQVVLSVEDWDGRAVGETSTDVRDLKPGETRLIDVPVEACPQGKNYFKFLPSWRGGAAAMKADGVGTSWTRPILDAVSKELRPDLPWGMNMCLLRPTPDHTIEERAALAGRCGIKWDRTEISTARIRPNRNTWDWSSTDRMVDTLHANGISVYGLLMFFPSWVKPFTEEAYVAYLEVAKAAAERYRGKVHGWEIWNEPNIFFWKGPKAEYFTLVDRAFKEIRSADPKVPVVALSASAVPDVHDFIRDFLSSGARFTDVSIHTYGGFPETRFLKEMDALSASAGGCKVWVSEMGWTTGVGPDGGEHSQASNLARLFLTVAGSTSVKVINWYDFVDDGYNPRYVEEAFGIVRRDLTPKPACRACATVCRTFAHGSASIEKRPVAADEHLWIFRMGGRSAVWTDGGERRQVRIVTSKVASVRNLMGETLFAPAEQAVVSVDGDHPVIVDGSVVEVTFEKQQ